MKWNDEKLEFNGEKVFWPFLNTGIMTSSKDNKYITQLSKKEIL